VGVNQVSEQNGRGSSLLEVDDVFAEVVSLVRRGEAVTRPALSQVTGLRRAVITQRVEQAISAGLIEDSMLGESTGGRAPRQLRFRSEAGAILAAMTGTQHLSVGVTDLAGNILAIHQQPWDITAGPQLALDELAAIMDRILADQEIDAPVWGVGIGVPGPIDFTTGRPVGTSLMPGWDGFDIRRYFEDRYHAPVWVDNDLNVMIQEEWQRGGGRTNPETDGNIILIKVSHGIGAGILSRGHIHRGRNGAAGDIGHMPNNIDGSVRCRCGQSGCLEAIAGGWALVRDATEAAKTGQSAYLDERLTAAGVLTEEDLSEGARLSDPTCVELINRSATLIGETLASLVTFFNPGTVYVGGIIPSAGDMFLVGVRRAVYQHALPLATRDLQILNTALLPEDGVIGAAKMSIEQLFHPETLPIWLPRTSPAGIGGLLYAPFDGSDPHGTVTDTTPSRGRILPASAARSVRR
jgi:predicted NBD/HSP70 family sugar kinase